MPLLFCFKAASVCSNWCGSPLCGRDYRSMHPLQIYQSESNQLQSKVKNTLSIASCSSYKHITGCPALMQNILHNIIIQTMSESELSRNARIKSFQQKILNRSITDLLFYDRLADYLLDCCNSEAKPNTLSLFSFIPLFVLAFVVRGPSTLSFLLTIVGILLHQLFDIANKKQAYRLSSFSLSTYYIDHLFDSLSASFLALTISALLQLDSSATLTAVFFFAILPFYTHHLAMYNSEYFTFSALSPTSQGLILTKLLFLIGAFYPEFFKVQMFGGVNIGHLYIVGAVIWLIIFVVLDLKAIIEGKRVTDVKNGGEEEYPLKNLFSVFMVGYITMEMTSVEPELLIDSSYFYLCFGVITLCSSHIISNLLLSYGYGQKYKQITLPFLFVVGIVVIYYFSCAFLLGGEDIESLVSKIVLGLTLAIFLLFMLQQTCKNVSYISSVLSS